MCLIATIDWSTPLWWIDVIFKVAVGLGAVIFVHELGHFLVAKACGVKCEKFMIGFDIGGYKLSRKWGDTEYGIGILPLGGYVKMLGQDDDPAHIAEQMQKSQVDATSTNAVQITGPDGEKYYVDRRSYLAKSVPQRMAIISAGVIMNIIFAFIFAVIAYGMGVPYQPCIVSETMPGTPAWQAGIEPGDEIIKIGDTVNPTFMQLRGGVTLGDLEDGIACVVRRAADGEIVSKKLKPERGSGLAKIGVAPPSTVVIYKGQPTQKDSPAARAKFVGLTGQATDLDAAAGDAVFSGGGKVVRVGDVAINDYRDWQAELARQPDQALLVTVRRTLNKSSVVAADQAQQPDLTLDMTFEVPVQRVRQFGLIMKMGAITAVQPGSPAVEAGLASGDVIETVDGKSISDGSSTDGWDPSTLCDYFRAAAVEGRSVELTVRRPAADGTADSSAKQLTIRVKPRVPTVFYSILPPDSPMGAPAIGIAYGIENTVHAVTAESPAASAGAQPGDKISEAKFIYPEDAKGDAPKAETIELSPEKPSWPAVFTGIQLAPKGTVVEFTIERHGAVKPHQIKIAPTPVDGLFVADRGFIFDPVVRIREAESFAEQVRYGWDETAESLTMVFRFLRKLGTQVPITMLGGPGTIAAAAGGAASQGLSSLLIFLTILSANLAVINFLPIPLLDGGHMVFLAYEGLRGQPANERVVVALHTVGFVFIISLMLFVIGLDIQRWIL